MYQMQEAVELWTGLICAMGRALVPLKTSWYVSEFTWKNQEWAYILVDETLGTLEIIDTACSTNEVEQLEPDCAQRTLRVKQYPMGNNYAKKDFLKSLGESGRRRYAPEN